MDLEGFYSGYFSARSGEGFALFMVKGRRIIGCDPQGVKFAGNIDKDEAGSFWTGIVKVSAPPNGFLIQGVSTGPEGIEYEMELKIPGNFEEIPYFSLATPLGQVNIKLVRISGLE